MTFNFVNFFFWLKITEDCLIFESIRQLRYTNNNIFFGNSFQVPHNITPILLSLRLCNTGGYNSCILVAFRTICENNEYFSMKVLFLELVRFKLYPPQTHYLTQPSNTKFDTHIPHETGPQPSLEGVKIGQLEKWQHKNNFPPVISIQMCLKYTRTDNRQIIRKHIRTYAFSSI